MTKKNLTKWVGWFLIVGSVVILGLPLGVHVVHFGLQVIKLVVEGIVFGLIFAVGVKLVRQ